MEVQQILRFKGWLSENNITQKEIASLLGISQQAVWNKVNGKYEFSLPQVRKICETYHVSADIFLPKELQYGNKEEL